MNWSYFNLNWSYFNLNWSYVNLNWSYFDLNWSYFTLKWKRCSVLYSCCNWCCILCHVRAACSWRKVFSGGRLSCSCSDLDEMRSARLVLVMNLTALFCVRCSESMLVLATVWTCTAGYISVGRMGVVYILCLFLVLRCLNLYSLLRFMLANVLNRVSGTIVNFALFVIFYLFSKVFICSIACFVLCAAYL